MQSIRQLMSLRAAWLALACGLAACSGSNDNTPPANSFAVQNLVSDLAADTPHSPDSNLVNPWGIAFGPTGPVWVANNATNTSTLYDGSGVEQALIVSAPANGGGGDANPTGIVFNGTTDFAIPGGSSPASFIFDGEGGTIAAWSSGHGAITVYDSSANGSVYKGLAIGSSGGNNFLYATDFHNNRIDVLDKNFALTSTPGGFVNPNLPAGYAPFGVQAINGQLYVSYAQQKAPDNHDNTDGAGLGLVDVFGMDGTFVKTLVAQGANNHLNAPWGLALAPNGFGPFGGALLVGNFGDGAINAFDLSTGAFIDSIRNPFGQPILIPGLWGIAFGNGSLNQPTTTLFLAAGINDEADGLYARIDPSSSASCTGYGCSK